MANDVQDPEVENQAAEQQGGSIPSAGLLLPKRVGFKEPFWANPAVPSLGIFTALEAGTERITTTQDLGLKAGNAVVLYVEAADASRDFKFGNFYDRVALVPEKGAPVDLDAHNELKIGDRRISFKFPEKELGGDKFWILLSGREGIRPVILKAALVLTSPEEEAEEKKREVERLQREREAGQKQSRPVDGAVSGAITQTIEGLMGGIAGSVKEGVLMNAGSSTVEASNTKDSSTALNKTLASWKGEYNRPGAGVEASVETESSDSVEVTAEAVLQSENKAVTGEQAATEIQSTIQSTVSAPLPSFSPQQRAAAQSVAADISQKVYGNLKSSVSMAITGEGSYQAARETVLQSLKTEKGKAYIFGLTPQQIHEATIDHLLSSNPQLVAQYRTAPNAFYGNPVDDPFVQNMQGEINGQIEAYLGKVQIDKDKQPELRLFLQNEVSNQVWRNFAKEFPDKAEAYQNKIPQLQQAIKGQVPSVPAAEPQPAASVAPEPPVAPKPSESTKESLPEPAVPPAIPQTPEQKEALKQIEDLKKRGKPIDDIARRMVDRPKPAEKSVAKQSGVSPEKQKQKDEPGQKQTAPEDVMQSLPETSPAGRPADLNIPAPLQMSNLPQVQQTPQSAAAGQQGLPEQQQPQPPGEIPPDQRQQSPLPAKKQKIKRLSDVEDLAADLLDATGPAGKVAEKEVMGAAFWWLFGFSWTIIPIFIYDLYWAFFHARKKKIWPLAVYQKVIIIALNVALFFLGVGIIAFFVRGCEFLAGYHLDQIAGGQACQIADAFKNGGLAGGIKEISNPTIAPGGPINVSQWRPQIISASNANGLPNACILTTLVAKESGGNQNAVSSTCSFDTMRGYDISQHSGPLYDLNWNCGHAFGLTQIYIFPQGSSAPWQDSNTPSRLMFNHYYTIPELVNPDTNLNLGAKYFANLLNSNPAINLSTYAQTLSSDDQLIWKAYRRYNGSGTAAEGYADDSMRRYQTCKTAGY